MHEPSSRLAGTRAALLFGASTPLAKLLVGQMPPLRLAGLLYLGSGLGLALLLLLRVTHDPAAAHALRIPARDWPWLLVAIACGGLVGPALLMGGLARIDSASAALLLNVEGVLTAAIAWWVFKENAGRRIVLDMAAIVAGGVLLSRQPCAATLSTGALLIAGACLAWAVDNNLTHKVSTNDAMGVACLKSLLAGAGNTGLALAGGAQWPGAAAVDGDIGRRMRHFRPSSEPPP